MTFCLLFWNLTLQRWNVRPVSYYILACFGLNCAVIGENLKGFSVKPVFASPLFHSKSPSDFWVSGAMAMLKLKVAPGRECADDVLVLSIFISSISLLGKTMELDSPSKSQGW